VKLRSFQEFARIICLVGCLPACADIDVVTASYATLAEARQAGAVGRWMPDGLPPSTYDIREAHDVDTNRRWAAFSFPPAERTAMLELLGEEISLTGQSCNPPGRIEWWPLLLRGVLDNDRIRSTGLRGYRAKQADLVFALNASQGRAYYWTPESAER
jgi:hypothetical protein